jgi:glycosyltransferase involved in cell wall biosynthesis
MYSDTPYTQKLKKVFILTNTLKSGGAEKQSIYLLKTLSKFYDTRLIVYYGNRADSRMTGLLGEYESNVIRLSGHHCSKIRFLLRLFRENKESACISYLATTNLLNAVLGKRANLRYRIGGIRNSQLVWWKYQIQKHLCNKWLTATVFNNFSGLEKYKRFNRNKCHVIHNCIDTQEIYPTTGEPHHPVTILCVGRFVKQKDFHTTIQCIKALSLKHQDFRCIIAGYGKQENRLKKQVKKLHLEKFINFVINPESVEEFYNSADIFLSTSLFEGLNNTIMEAMSFGLPVVATDVGDNQYLVLHEKTGYLLPVKDKQGLSEKLHYLISEPQIRKKLGEEGMHHISAHFSKRQFVHKYLTLFKTLEDGAK